MTWTFDEEHRFYENHGLFDAYMFQSQHQNDLISAKLRKYGDIDNRSWLIRGCFSLDEFPFEPRKHSSGDIFHIGRISRDDPDKYSSNTFPIYQRIPYPCRARLMAWNQKVEKKLGKPPHWVETLEANQESPQEFFRTLHCMVQINGGAGENWPRSGLEAMASGVPVVVQNNWGWKEMIRHKHTGFLCGTDDDISYYPAVLARDEDLRMEIATNARKSLEEELANPEVLWDAWKRLFSSLS